MEWKVFLSNLSLLGPALKGLPTAYCFQLSPVTLHPFSFTFHALTPRLVLFVLIHIPASVVVNRILFLGAVPWLGHFAVFPGSSEPPRWAGGLKACILDMTGPIRGGREAPHSP
jgi:hypothetical protein